MPNVYWVIPAQRALLRALSPGVPARLRGRVYRRISRILARTFPESAAVLVQQRLQGYRKHYDVHVLVVEVIQKSDLLEPNGSDNGAVFGRVDLQTPPDELCRPVLTTAAVVKIVVKVQKTERDAVVQLRDELRQPDRADKQDTKDSPNKKSSKSSRRRAEIDRIAKAAELPRQLVKLLLRPKQKLTQRQREKTVSLLRKEESQRLKEEIQAWNSCRPVGMSHHGILMLLRCGTKSPRGRLQSIVYENAHHVLGGSQISSLEDAVLNSVRWGLPTTESLKVVLKLIFEQLGNDLYSRSAVVIDPVSNLKRIRRRLKKCIDDWQDQQQLPASELERLRTRREVVGVLGDKREGFIDPADYLRSVLECPRHCPQLLWGCAHGDLHGHNALVSIVDGDVTLPALFDYEDMNEETLIGWDFVKLESELKVRALPLLLAGSELDYIDRVYKFERHLAERTQRLHDQIPDRANGAKQARDNKNGNQEPAAGATSVVEEYMHPAPAGTEQIAELVMAVRAAAREHMGVRRLRDRRWLEEYYFLLAYYGTQACRWETYQRRNVMAGWIAAGVAARLLSRPWNHLDAEIRQAESVAEAQHKKRPDRRKFQFKKGQIRGEMAHHTRLAFACKSYRCDGEPDYKSGEALLLQLRDDYPHILAIEEELALLYFDSGNKQQSERVLRGVEQRYNLLSEEMLCRFGRKWKDEGAQRGAKDVSVDRQQHFLRALHWYDRAFAIRQNHYPGINVATLQFLLRNPVYKTILERVEESCRAAGERESAWVDATRGEACLLAGKFKDAVRHYQHARTTLSLRDRISSRGQVELIVGIMNKEARKYWDEAKLDSVFGKESRARLEPQQQKKRKK